MTFDLIGTLYKETGVVVDDTSQMEAINGYHLNVLPSENMSLVTPYIVEVNSLTRVFAGRDDTIALKFANRSEWLALGIEEI
jgi:maleate cis-trans isomerase